MTHKYRGKGILMKTRCVMSSFAILVLAGCHQSERTTDLPVDVALQQALDESIIGSGVKAVSAAVIFPDGNMWAGASGVSHEGVPVTTDMIFDIGSIEKNFQAALTLKLVEDGLISLNDPLEKWFPPYPNVDGKITIRQLLGMTSGLDDIVDDADSPWRIGYENIDYDKVWTWADIYNSYIKDQSFEPGAKCAYSNTNYIVLKHVIEQVTRQKQTVELENRIIGPYGLNHTLVDFTKPIPESLHIAHGWYDIGDDGTADDISGNSLDWLASIAPVLVYSTPSDMVTWIDALFHKKIVLKPETLKAMLSFRGPVMNEPMMNGYGLGVVDINLGTLMPRWRHVEVCGHLGSQFGYSTLVGYFPDLNISVAIMFNRGCDRETNGAIATVSDAFFSVLFRRLGAKELNQLNSLSDLLDELQSSPGDVHLMRNIATMYREEGANDKALSMYERILKEDPDDMFGYRTNSLFWEASLTASLKLQPDKLLSFIANHQDYRDIQFAYKNLIETYKKRNEVDNALAVLKVTVVRFSEDASFLNYVAWWIFENKVESEYSTAIAYAEKAAVLTPSDYAIWDTLAQLYRAIGWREKAIEASERALSLAPENQREEYEGYLSKIKKGR